MFNTYWSMSFKCHRGRWIWTVDYTYPRRVWVVFFSFLDINKFGLLSWSWIDLHKYLIKIYKLLYSILGFLLKRVLHIVINDCFKKQFDLLHLCN